MARAREDRRLRNLAWEYWDGSRWADLESGFGFTDQTNQLARDGAIFWTSDPTGWSELAIDGDTDLFYVRAHVASGAYSIPPTEKEIRTDILLFQYTKDITGAAQNFVFGVPPAFDVSISSATNQTFGVGTLTPVSRPRSPSETSWGARSPPSATSASGSPPGSP